MAKKAIKSVKSDEVKSDGSSEKLCAILGYIFPIGLIWYLVDEKMKKDEFVGFHVKQGLVLAIVSFVFWIAYTVLSILTLGVGAFLLYPILLIFDLLFLILWILGIVNAANDKQKELPIIGKFGKKFNF